MLRVDACLAREQTSFDDGEVPAACALRMRPTLDEVIGSVAAATRVDRGAICERHSRSVARAAAMYLAYNLTGLPQRQIGARFGVGRFAVSKAVAMIDNEQQTDRHLRRRLSRLRRALSERRP